MIHNTFEGFFTRVKNFANNQDVLKKSDLTNRIQHVIETF